MSGILICQQLPVTVSAADHTLPAKIPSGNAPGGSRKLMGPLRHILVTFVWLSQSLRWDLWVGRDMSGSTATHHTTDDGSAWLMAALCSGKNRERPLRSDPGATSSTRKRQAGGQPHLEGRSTELRGDPASGYSSVTPMLGNLKSATGPQDGSLPFCKLRGLGLMLSKGPPNGTHANDVLGGLAFGFESQVCHRATWQLAEAPMSLL